MNQHAGRRAERKGYLSGAKSSYVQGHLRITTVILLGQDRAYAETGRLFEPLCSIVIEWSTSLCTG